MKQVLDTVSETVPCRALVLHESDASTFSGVIGDDGAAMHASVEANFRDSPSGRREIVAEEITIETPQLHSRRLPSLVRSLLLPDVPTTVLVHNPALDADWLRPCVPMPIDSFSIAVGCAAVASLVSLPRSCRSFGRATRCKLS